MKNLLVFIALFSCMSAFAQPANDECTAATSLGTLGAPANCGNGIKKGAVTNVAGTNVAATPGSPYVYLTGCNQAQQANDVWYSFVAPTNGYGLTIKITGGTLANPNMALYSGTNCDSLTGIDCVVGVNDTASITVGSGVIPGQTYYLQVSGNVGQSGTFNLAINAFQNCADCLNSASLTVTPLPVNGTYQAGQVVSFCFHITKWTQTANNWLHGVQMAFGPGWNLASLTTSPPPPYLSTAAMEGGGTPATCGNWAYYPAGETSSATGTSYPAGFYFNGGYTFSAVTGLPSGCTSAADGNPGNNFGDGISNPLTSTNVYTPPANEWNFCWTIAVETGCNPGVSLSVQVTTTGDGESGAWSNPGCANDPVTNFTALITCCPPTMASTPTCSGTNNGTVTATPVGNAGPYTYTWSSGGQTTAQETGVPTGPYTVTVVDANQCSSSASVTVAADVTPVSNAGNAISFCSGGTGNIGTAATGGYTYAWSPTNGLNSATASNPTVTLTNVTANPVTTAYTVTTTSAAGCTASATVNVTVDPIPVPLASNTGPYCLGNTIQLGATGGGTYSWSGPGGFTSASQTPTLAGATAAMAGVYTVTVTSASNCTATSSTTVGINASLVPVVTNTGPYCLGATVQLGAAGGTTYQWSGPNGFTSASQAPTINGATLAMAGTYNVTATNPNGCSGTGTTTVVVNPSPTPTASNTGPYCITSTIQLAATGGSTYAWSGPNAYTSANQNPSITNATVAMTGAYNVTVTDAHGCTATASTQVLVTSTLTPIVSNTGPYCTGNTITLNVQGGIVYTWSGPNAFSSASQSPTITGASATVAGAYNVTATDANGCSGTGSTTVVVNPLPTPTASNTGPYCGGTSIQLGALGGTTFAWSGPSAYTSSSQTPAIPNATVAMAGTYNVTVTDANNCSATTSTTVVVNPAPVVNAGPAALITCTTAQPSLNAAAIPAGDTYNWGGPGIVSGGTTATPVVNIVGNYILTVTDGNNCSATGSATVTADVTPPGVTAGTGGTLTCTIQSITLTATSPVANATFVWSNGINVAANPVTTANTYTVTATDPGNGCTASSSSIVTTNTATPDVNAGPAETLGCLSGIRLAGSSSTTNAVYNWSGGSITSGATTATPLVSMTGTYTLTVSDPANGCTASASTQVNPSPVPVISGQVVDNPCPNVFLGQVSAFVSSGTPPYSYLWSNGARVAEIGMLAGGTYNVTVTDSLSCTASATYTIFDGSYAVIAEHNATINLGQSVELTGTVIGGSGTYTYIWNPSYHLSCQECQNTIATPYVTHSYVLQATDTNGCTGYDTVVVTVIPIHTVFIPNAFTPNGDGNNDYFNVFGDLNLVQLLQTRIFDRWGELVFESNDVNFKWDGTYKGQKMNPQVLVYEIHAVFLDGFTELFKGTVTLVR